MVLCIPVGLTTFCLSAQKEGARAHLKPAGWKSAQSAAKIHTDLHEGSVYTMNKGRAFGVRKSFSGPAFHPPAANF